ncbi:hypothetical protein PVAP13_4KG183733 [Panicum virgatum]|uniref:Uncharacterized protein n=1 Tax=Panicum virgatum TaxID=38727 RepID=A0A8T0TEK5_PANVG|nr:hypothetical protein PVAP13_4KG183733 [Panicum virgatum]
MDRSTKKSNGQDGRRIGWQQVLDLYMRTNLKAEVI